MPGHFPAVFGRERAVACAATVKSPGAKIKSVSWADKTGPMIQRIQSLYLLLAAAAGFGLLGLPFASSNEAVSAPSMFADRLYSIQDQIALLVIFSVAAALALAGIFLFNNRSLQMRLAQISFIANFIGLLLAIILFIQDPVMSSATKVDDSWGLYLPLISLVFLILALRSINKDDKLVRSMDRLR